MYILFEIPKGHSGTRDGTYEAHKKYFIDFSITILMGPRPLDRVFFAQFSGNAKQGFVRDFELDHFLSQLDGKKSELGNFYLIFQQFF